MKAYRSAKNDIKWQDACINLIINSQKEADALLEALWDVKEAEVLCEEIFDLLEERGLTDGSYDYMRYLDDLRSK